MRVDLYFRAGRDPELERKVPGIDIIRLRAHVRFKTAQGWTDAYSAIVDTGAPISLIPDVIWEKLQRTELADHTVGGIGPGSLPVKVARVWCQLFDSQGNQSQEMEMHAFLVQPGKKAPLILGFKDLLDRLPTSFNYPSQQAHVEEP